MRGAAIICCSAVLAASACVREDPFALPELGAARAVVIGAEEDGRYALASFAREPGAPFGMIPLVLDASRDPQLYVSAYDRSLEELRLDAGPLALTGGGECGRLLPDPDRALTTAAGAASWRAIDPPRATPLGALRIALSEGSCERIADPVLYADVRCMTENCTPRLTQNQCALELDPAECDFEVTRGELGAGGELCFLSSERLGQCDEVPPARDAVRALLCKATARDDCLVELYAPPPAKRFRVDRVSLGTVTATVPHGFERPPLGFISDLAIAGDRIVVSHHAGWSVGWQCGLTTPDELVFLDPDTMMPVVPTATTPPCLTQIIADPFGDGVLGAYGGQAPHIARFDGRGRKIADTAFPEQKMPPASPTSIAIAGDPPRVVVTMTFLSLGQPGDSRLLVADARTLAPIPIETAIPSAARELVAFPPNATGRPRFAAVDDTLNGIYFIDAATLAATRGPNVLGRIPSAISDVGQALRLPGSELILFSLTGVGGGIFLLEEDAEDPVGRAQLYERLADTWAIHVWPADPSKVIVGLTDRRGSREASLALFDPARDHPRYLPGAETVGIGAIGRFREDGRGRLWTTLPWTAEVLRIEAAP